MVFGQTLRDFLPAMIHDPQVRAGKGLGHHPVTQEYRERTLAMKRDMDDKRWSHSKKDLDDLQVGAPVSNHPNKWDKTGIVLENKLLL